MTYLTPRLLVLLALAGCASPPAPIVPIATGPDDCPRAGWCWMRGRPMTLGGDRTLGTAYAIGAEGAFLRWDGDRWAAMAVPTRRTLTSAWLDGAGNAWASDDTGSAWHFDGTRWAEAPADWPIHRIIGGPAGVVWALASGATSGHGGLSETSLLRRDGDHWTLPMEPYAYCLGGDFTVREDGEVWSAGLVCDADGTVYAVEVRRFDGTSWQRVGDPILEQSWYPEFLQTFGPVRFHGTGTFEWTGSAWAPYTQPSPPTDLASGEVAWWDGLGFTRLPEALGCEQLFRLDAENAWCAEPGQIHRESAGEWSSTLVDPFIDESAPELWGTIPATVWAGADSRRAWGSGPTDVYRVRWSTDAALEHFDGTRWTIVLEGRVNDVHGTSASDVWIATERGPVHFDGTAFVPMPIPAELERSDVLRVRVLGDGVVLAMTAHALFAYDGAWALAYTAPENFRLSAVGGANVDDLWVVQPREGRTNEVALVHGGGAAWSSVVAAVTATGELTTTADGETWLASEGVVTHLGSPDPVIGSDWRVFDASLWVTPDAIWITTHDQARRYLME